MPTTAVYSASHLARHMSTGRPLRPLEANPFNYYALAEAQVAGFFASGCLPVALSYSTLGRMLGEATSSQARIRVQDNLHALRRFEELFRGLDRQNFTFLPLDADRPLVVGGMRLEVRPHAALQRRREDGTLEVGLLKIHFFKTEAMGVAPARFLLGLMRTWALRRLARLGKVRRAHILLMDVSDMTLYRASTGFTCPHLVEHGCAGFSMGGLAHKPRGRAAR
jgi:hypothetical protein